MQKWDYLLLYLDKHDSNGNLLSEDEQLNRLKASKPVLKTYELFNVLQEQQNDKTYKKIAVFRRPAIQEKDETAEKTE